MDASGSTDSDSASLTYRWDVDGDGDDISDVMAAEFIAECWRARAAADFPDRNIVVEVVDQYGPTVVMYEPNV